MTDRNPNRDPDRQEQAVDPRPDRQDPTAVDRTRESDASTINNGGLGGGRPAGAARKDAAPHDPVMPDDESTLNTKI